MAVLTREEILQMEAGREMDTLVAGRVMGWHQEQDPDVPKWFYIFDEKGEFRLSYPHYSTEIFAAWQVVEKMAQLGFSMDIESGWENLSEYCAYRVKFCKPHYYETAQYETAPLAICRAALLTTLEDKND